MTRVLVVSDSHGDRARLAEILEMNPRARWIIHLGDGAREAEDHLCCLTGKNICRVSGNCDFDPELAPEALCKIEGMTVFVCHGHTRGVKHSLSELYYAARERGARLALFGHTHEPLCEEREGLLMFNPGSAHSGSYGVIDIDGGEIISAKHYRLA